MPIQSFAAINDGSIKHILCWCDDDKLIIFLLNLEWWIFLIILKHFFYVWFCPISRLSIHPVIDSLPSWHTAL